MIKSAASPAEAKAKIMEKAWQPGVVIQMLERAGSIASKPEGLSDELGLIDDTYKLSDTQAQAILDLRLHRLTGLEQDKIIKEYEEFLVKIADLLDILASGERLMQVIRDELLEIKEQYGDERRTEIIASQEDLSIEDLITEEDVVVTLSMKSSSFTDVAALPLPPRRCAE